jgi:hypothetical protein
LDPPDFAIPAQLPRTSLLSLLDAPHQLGPPLRFNIPTTPAPGPAATQQTSAPESESHIRPHTSAATYGVATVTKTTKVPLREETTDPSLASRIMKQQRTPSRSANRADDDGPSFDINNPALTPTMTREQALAQIRERRVRAQSVGKMAPMVPEAQQQRPASRAAVTPRRPADKDRRDVSAPTARTGGLGVAPSARRVRS